MASYGRHLAARAPARSQKTAAEGLGRKPTDRGRGGGKIHLHEDGQGGPLGVTATGANVHDSRLIGAPLKNAREMGSLFLGTEIVKKDTSTLAAPSN